MPDLTPAEQVTWQRQAAALLDKLLALGARRKLPVIMWTVQTGGSSLTGEALSHPSAGRRSEIGAWKAAITTASGQAPAHDSELALGNGETRLIVSWEPLPVRLVPDDSKRYPRTRLALVASIWPDEEDGDG